MLNNKNNISKYPRDNSNHLNKCSSSKNKIFLKSKISSQLKKKINYFEKKPLIISNLQKFKSKSKEIKKNKFSNFTQQEMHKIQKPSNNLSSKTKNKFNFQNKFINKPTSSKYENLTPNLLLKFRSEEQQYSADLKNDSSQHPKLDYSKKLILIKNRRMKGKIKSQDYQIINNKPILKHNSQVLNYNTTKNILNNLRFNEHLNDLKVNKYTIKPMPNTDRIIKSDQMNKDVFLIRKEVGFTGGRKQSFELNNVLNNNIRTRQNNFDNKSNIKAKLYTKTKLNKCKPKLKRKLVSLCPDNFLIQPKELSKILNKSKVNQKSTYVKQNKFLKIKRFKEISNPKSRQKN